MAQLPLHRVAPNFTGVLNATITDADSSCVLRDVSVAYPEVPFWFYIGDEAIECDSVTEDTPSAGYDTLSLSERGANGTGAAAHTAGDTAQQLVDANVWSEHQDRLLKAETCVIAGFGGGPGVIPSAVGLSDLEVTAQGTPDMTVNVAVGGAVVDSTLAYLHTTYDTAAMTAPTGNPRIDLVQITSAGEIEVKTGSEAGSPSAPAADSDALGLAEIYHRVGEMSIKDTDDSTNGYITDVRDFV